MTQSAIPPLLPPSAEPPPDAALPSLAAPLPGIIAAPPDDRRELWKGNLYGIASMLVWAAGFPAADRLLQTWDPLALITGRFGFACLLLLPIWLLVDGPGAIRSAPWRRGLGIGALTLGSGAYLLLLAQYFTDAVTVAIIASATPIAATVVELFYIRRRIGIAFAAGLVASVIGGVVATGDTAVPHLGLGALCALASVAIFSWGSFLTVRDLASLSQIGRGAVTILGGFLGVAAMLTLMTQLGFASLPDPVFTPTSVGLLVIYGCGGMAISQVLWLWSVDKLGVAVAAFHINVAPFYVMLIMMALGGGWSWPQAIGGAIVVLGVLLAQADGKART